MLLLRWLYSPKPRLPFAENAPPLKAAAFPVAEQQFSGYIAQPPFPGPAVGSRGRWSDIAVYLRTVNQFASFQPAGTIVSTTTQSGYNDQPPEFAKPFPISEQQFSTSYGYLAPSQFVPQVTSQSPDIFAKPYPANLQRFPDLAFFIPLQPVLAGDGAHVDIVRVAVVIGDTMAYPAQTFVTGATPSNFGYSESPPQFGKLFPVVAQRFPDFVPQGTIVSITPQGGMSDQPPQFARLLAVTQQQFAGQVVPAAFQPRVFTEPPPFFAKAFAAALSRNEFITQSSAATATPSAFGYSESPLQFGKPFPAFLQRNPDYAAQAFTAAATPTAFGYSESPLQFAKLLPVSLQTATGFLLVPAATFVGNGSASGEMVVQPTLVIAHNMQYAAQSIVRQPYVFAELPPEFVKAFAVAVHRYPDRAPFSPPAATPGPFGFSQSPERFANPFPAFLQRNPDYAVQTFVSTATPSAFGYSESPTRFAASFPASQQQFGAFQPLGTITFKSKGGEWIIRARRRHKR